MIESIDHVNLVVRDLEKQASFYCQMLGFRRTKEAVIRGEWIGDVVGLRDVEAEVLYLDLPAGPRVELLRYISPVGAEPPGLDQANTIGLRHLAFRVTGIDQMVERLTAAGVRFLSRVHCVPDSQVTYAGGVRKHLVYFRDPEGNLLELCEYK